MKYRIVLGFAICALAVTQALAQVNTSKWQSFSTKDKSFSIRAPKGWISPIDEDPESRSTLEVVRKKYPEIGKWIDQGIARFDLILLNSAHEIKNGISNFSVKFRNAEGMEPKMLPEVAKLVASKAGLQNFGYEKVRLPVGNAIKFWGDLDESDGVISHARLTCYLFLKSDKVFFCNFATSRTRESEEKPIFEAMAKSIVIK